MDTSLSLSFFRCIMCVLNFFNKGASSGSLIIRFRVGRSPHIRIRTFGTGSVAIYVYNQFNSGK